MAEITNKSDYISDYLNDLKSCLDQAKRCEAEKAADYAAARAKFNRKSEYFAKVKTAWENIQTTNAKATNIKAALNGLTCVCEKLETYLTCDMDTFIVFVGDVKAFSQKLEHYHCCVDKLCQAIDKVSATSLQKDNKIIVALQELKAKYDSAIAAATAVIPEVMGTLEELCFLYLKMKGDEINNIEECDPLSDDGSTPPQDNCGDLQPCESNDNDGVQMPADPDCDCKEVNADETMSHPSNCEGIKDSMNKIQKVWNSNFPLNGADENENPKCAYYNTTEEEYKTAKCQKKCANEALEQAIQLRNLATSQRTSIEQSYHAALAANKC